MKRFNNYIFENSLKERPDTKVLTDDEFMQIVSENCKDFYVDDVCINRYVALHNDRIYLIDPSQTTRKSRDNLNIYTLIMDNEPDWKAFPKRSRSLICTIRSICSNFLVVPFDGANFGICYDSEDIWWTFNKRIKKIESNFEHNSELISTIRTIGHQLLGRAIRDDNYTEMCEDIDVLDEFLNKYYKNENWSDITEIRDKFELGKLLNFYRLIKKEYKTLLDFLKELYSVNFSVQDGENFTNKTYNEIQEHWKGKSRYSSSECWTDSKCILIPRNFIYNDSKYDKILKIKNPNK
jgi:hypothetical protein